MFRIIQLLCIYFSLFLLGFANEGTEEYHSIQTSDVMIDRMERLSGATDNAIEMAAPTSTLSSPSMLVTPNLPRNTATSVSNQRMIADWNKSSAELRNRLGTEGFASLVSFAGGGYGLSIGMCQASINNSKLTWLYAALSSTPFWVTFGLRLRCMQTLIKDNASWMTWNYHAPEMVTRVVHTSLGIVAAYYIYERAIHDTNEGRELMSEWGPILDQYKNETNCMYTCYNPQTDTYFSCPDAACKNAVKHYQNGQDLASGQGVWGMALLAYYIPYMVRSIWVAVDSGYLSDD